MELWERDTLAHKIDEKDRIFSTTHEVPTRAEMVAVVLRDLKMTKQIKDKRKSSDH